MTTGETPCWEWAGEIRLGVTGSRSGMTFRQAEMLEIIVRGALELHHGDCVGADERAAMIARRAGIHIIGHPPTNPAKRAFFPSNETLPSAPYMERNQSIVDAVDVLVVLPSGTEETQQRSGTWATARRARAAGVPTIVLRP